MEERLDPHCLQYAYRQCVMPILLRGSANKLLPMNCSHVVCRHYCEILQTRKILYCPYGEDDTLQNPFFDTLILQTTLANPGSLLVRQVNLKTLEHIQAPTFCATAIRKRSKKLSHTIPGAHRLVCSYVGGAFEIRKK